MALLTDLAAAVRQSGLRVVEVDGWQRRGRPATTGDFHPRGVLVHHTGSNAPDSGAYIDWLAKTGRSDLPAPLCQLALGRDGTVYLCAAGRANHAGKAQASGPIPAGDGNELYIGIEALNDGSEGWSTAQYDAFVRLCAALCRHYGWTAAHVRAHKETSVTGKWDPGALDMTKFREDVAKQLNPKPDPSEEDDMAWLDQPLNEHNPQGRQETRDVTYGELMKALALFLESQPGPHQAFLAAARKSAATKEK